MKNNEKKQKESRRVTEELKENALNFNSSLPEHHGHLLQAHHVALPPTETGRRRLDLRAHKTKPPKFLQNIIEYQQSLYPENYLG